MPLLPEKRDVDAASRMAMADFRDYKRCKVEYGVASEVTESARAAYESSWAHYLTTKELYGSRLAAEGATA